MPDTRCDLGRHPLDLDAVTVLHVVPAHVVFQGIRPREVIVVLVHVPPDYPARAIDAATNRLAADGDAHIAEGWRVRHGNWKAVVRTGAVLLGEDVRAEQRERPRPGGRG